VKGLERTSFIPIGAQTFRDLIGVKNLPDVQYATISSGRLFPVMAIIGVDLSNRRMIVVAERPSSLGITMSCQKSENTNNFNSGNIPSK
jgi:hypothetical protein